jgi:glycosyltransferase involved in cell wall biosynthesis
LKRELSVVEGMSAASGFSADHIPFLSVIIPVFNEGARLRLCLDALASQTYPKDRYEVIVVDNGSDEPPVWVMHEYPEVVFVEESRPGSYAARNRGIGLAKGEVFAFTDGDCIPDSYWLANGAKEVIADPSVGLVGGRVEFFFRDPERPTVAELYDSIMYLNQRTAVEVTGFAATANMFTSRSVLKDVGVFDAQVKSGGDREWGQRVRSRGYRLVYAEDAVVKHPARDTFAKISSRNVRVLGGHHELYAREGRARRWIQLVKELFHDLAPPIPFVRRLVRDDRIEGASTKALVTLMHVRAKLVNARARLLLGFGAKPTRS